MNSDGIRRAAAIVLALMMAVTSLVAAFLVLTDGMEVDQTRSALRLQVFT